jgi:hypothetical protein
MPIDLVETLTMFDMNMPMHAKQVEAQTCSNIAQIGSPSNSIFMSSHWRTDQEIVTKANWFQKTYLLSGNPCQQVRYAGLVPDAATGRQHPPFIERLGDAAQRNNSFRLQGIDNWMKIGSMVICLALDC